MSKKNLSTNEFFAKYNHPNWQKRRLEIMELSGFECSDCGSKDKTLNVHHRFYVKGRDPWEYEDDALQCLCKDCHGRYHETEDRLKQAINAYKTQWWNFSIDQLVGFLEGRLADGPYYRVKATDNFHEYMFGYCLASGIVLTEELTTQLIDVYSHMGGLYEEAFRLLVADEISIDRAKYIQEFGVEAGDLYPQWLLDKVRLLVDGALENTNQAEAEAS